MPTLAPALATLRAQIDAKFPTRSKASDGWIASAAHLDRTGAGADASQHNPNAFDVVCAIDVTEDLSVGLDAMRLLNELDALNDPRFRYGIHDGQIENSDDTRTPYHGSSPHTLHLHVSTWHRRPDLYNDGRPWALPMLSTVPEAPPAILAAGKALTRGQALEAGNYRLVMQGDGNLVLYRRTDGRAMWQTDTDGKAGDRLVMQGDGNLVLYRADGRALWHTATNGKGATRLAVQADGNLVLYRPDDRPVWALR